MDRHKKHLRWRDRRPWAGAWLVCALSLAIAATAVCAGAAHASTPPAVAGDQATNNELPEALAAFIDEMAGRLEENLRSSYRDRVEEKLKADPEFSPPEPDARIETAVSQFRNRATARVRELSARNALTDQAGATAVRESRRRAYDEFNDWVRAELRGVPLPERDDDESALSYFRDLARATIIDQNPMSAWLTLLGFIGLGVLVGWAVSTTMRSTSKRLESHDAPLRGQFVSSFIKPVNLLLMTLGVRIGLDVGRIWMPAGVDDFFDSVLGMLVTVSVFWALWNLCGVFTTFVAKVTATTGTTLDNQLVPLLRKTLRIFLLILFALFVADNIFKADVTGFLAGLGIAGLAVSLAAQDSLRNVFGSVTILADKPFKIGDRINLKGYIGTVEEIGFRSTKLRTFDGHMVSVPNSIVVNESVENIASRPSIRRRFTIGITYDTKPEKLREAIEILKELLDGHEWINPDFPPRVVFESFGDFSLNILVQYHFFPPDHWEFMAFSEWFNLQVFERFNAGGIDFAFPSRTLYLAGDAKRKLSVEMLGADLKGPQAS
ncbi:MAG: hypothetical protein EA376_02075 [Phycisphaeraceae bacterium]|nr:MAG: hypothetical protein EA376_02075 [Phycisphaeraceae bacterium]